MSVSSAEFAKGSTLDIIIPQASNVDIEEALSSSKSAGEPDDGALVTSILQRSLLFFGTKINQVSIFRCLTHR